MMPDTKSRRDSEFAKYDAMSTEELQQLLREDASKPVGEESDTEVIFYIMEVLAKRRKEQNEGKSPAEALESFRNKYYEENENSLISESVPVARKRSSGRWKRGLAAAVAAICIFVVGNSITANALGFDLWDIVAKWTQETFHFGYAGQSDEINAPSPDFSRPCASLQIALDEYKVSVALVPTWLPEGYEETEIKTFETPVQRQFFANYQSGDNSIRIRITDYLDTHPAQVEQSDALIEIYTSAEVDYYIFDNFDQLKAVWINGSFECSIAGSISVSEIKQMIDSIGKG